MDAGQGAAGQERYVGGCTPTACQTHVIQEDRGAMIHPGDRVRWEAQPGRTIEGYDWNAEGLVVPAGTGIVLAVARGDIPMSKWIERGANKRSYIVRSDEDFNNPQIDRQLLWLVDIRPE